MDEGRERLLARYEKKSSNVVDLVARFVAPGARAEVTADAKREFAAMVDEIPYADRPSHTMFAPSFGIYQFLAVYKAARGRGYSAHELGRAILATPLARTPKPASDEVLQKMKQEAAASQRSAAPNEFVFELVEGEGAETDWGMNITTCAVCHAFARHDAMDLVPYMCATDDVESDAGGLGLRRTGTIALGAHRCDFRYKAGGEPRPLAPQYPEAIRVDERAGETGDR